jgi:hypothetical protein
MKDEIDSPQTALFLLIMGISDFSGDGRGWLRAALAEATVGIPRAHGLVHRWEDPPFSVSGRARALCPGGGDPEGLEDVFPCRHLRAGVTGHTCLKRETRLRQYPLGPLEPGRKWRDVGSQEATGREKRGTPRLC